MGIDTGLRRLLAAAAIALVTPAHAALQPRDLDGNGSIDAYYDSALKITWLKDVQLLASQPFGLPYGQNLGTDIYGQGSVIYADGLATWGGALKWIGQMNAAGYLGYHDWRLPTLRPLNGVDFQYFDGNDYVTGRRDEGFNVSAPGSFFDGSTASELAYMFFNNLGNRSIYDPKTGEGQPVHGLVDDPSNPSDESLFVHLDSRAYWTDTTYAPAPANAWVFNTIEGQQTNAAKGFLYYAWAVRSGDVSPVPEPSAATLLALGIAAIAGLRRRQR